MSGREQSRRLARIILTILIITLPTLSLIPLGAYFLWQQRLVLHWAAFAFVTALAISAIELAFLRSASASEAIAPSSHDSSPLEFSHPLERAAWADVARLAQNVDLDALNSQQAFIDLGFSTIETVARNIHPERADPLWEFTLPQALAIVEQVSRRLSIVVDSHVPFGDRLTIAQVRTAYRWRGALDYADTAYDVWRIIRLLNPAAAVTNEARERLTRAALNWGKERITRAIAVNYVEEVGRAAIDLYGGRLMGFAPDTASAGGAPADGPTVCRIFVLATDKAAAVLVSGRMAAIATSSVRLGTFDLVDDQEGADADVVVWLGSQSGMAADRDVLHALLAERASASRVAIILPVSGTDRQAGPLPNAILMPAVRSDPGAVRAEDIEKPLANAIAISLAIRGQTAVPTSKAARKSLMRASLNGAKAVGSMLLRRRL